ncbi:hypothetical protein [Shewanella pneumatophori]|uniref:Uncharacterized protein n=1 Tax=Shewanella pneumatophori TaxID=314092 RepID=A0A9X2CFH6_9GAMM|nr:hypothetical protein [Shewanella pneumatophori]MCL1137821.1 hypothetical protein [Shewanella pneumatophori]
MRKVLINLLVYSVSFNLFAIPYDVNQGYDCNKLNDDLTNHIAITPERKIRASLNTWQEHKGEIPELKISLVNLVYFLCKEDRNTSRQVQDIVFDILTKAQWSERLNSVLGH